METIAGQLGSRPPGSANTDPAGNAPQAVSAADPGILLFDGQCGFCNAMADFVRRRDRHARFRLVSQQSEAGGALLARHGVARDLDTVVLIEAGAVFTRSTAALRIAWRMGWPWKLLTGLLVTPAFLRDPLYAAFARRRHRWFGRSGACALPRGGQSEPAPRGAGV